MIKSIYTLIPDIQELVTKKGWFNDQLAEEFAGSVSKRMQLQYGEHTYTPSLRLSQMGPRCPKAVWHSVHDYESREALQAWAEVKYSFGHIVEALAITLAKAAGHTVEGEQDELVLDGIVGHRDCVIDGRVVDVKSSSSIGFQKFKSSQYELVDTFGYLDQLDGYVVASADDPIVKVKDKGYILAIEKQMGHMVLYEHTVRSQQIKSRVASYKSIVSLRAPPPCECGTRSQGQSGNIELDIRASYNPYKYCCFPRLRTFLYAGGPVYLCKVVKHPTRKDGTKITEVDKHGKIVYN